MAQHTKEDEAKGRKLLTAVERLVASNEVIRQKVAECEARARATEAGKKKDTLREFTAKELIRTYSNRTALAGGASALPALIPGVGSVAAAVAGTFVELAYLLKSEVELSLALSHLYGFDIDEPKERQLAFLLASVGTYDAAGGNFVADVAKAEGVAIWNYAPRRVGSFLVTVMTGVALMYLWRGFAKAIPIVGVVVGTAANKVLTRRVGERVARDLRTRYELLHEAPGAAPAKAKPQRPARKPAAKRPSPRLKVVEGK